MIRSFALCFCIILGIAHASFCSSSTQGTLEKPAYFCDLIVEGRIQSTHVDSIRLFSEAPRPSWITELNILIDHLWAGYYDYQSIIITVLGGSIEGKGSWISGGHTTEFAVGDTVLLFVRYEPSFKRFFSLEGLEFRLTNNRVILGKIAFHDDLNTIHSSIAKVAMERSLNGLFAQSDVIVEGEALDSYDRDTKFVVLRAYKGSVAADTIVVTMKGFGEIFGDAPWIYYGPRGFTQRSLYLLFLKETNSKYYPFAGTNGVFEKAEGYISNNGRRLLTKWMDLQAQLQSMEKE